MTQDKINELEGKKKKQVAEQSNTDTKQAAIYQSLDGGAWRLEQDKTTVLADGSSWRSGDGIARLATTTVLAVVIQLVAMIGFVWSVRASGSAPALNALALITSGPYSMVFWGGAIVAGSVLPILLGLVGLKRPSVGLTAVTSVLESGGATPVTYDVRQAAAPSTPIEAGTQQITASVTVVFEAS